MTSDVREREILLIAMGEESFNNIVPQPTVSPLNLEREEHWRHFDNSVNAVSFGFVATAILISMFLAMAIFERFIRPRSTPSGGGRRHTDLEAQMIFHGKLNYPSPKMTVYAKGVSVLMPGEEVPTFIAHPAPVPVPAPAPCPPERVSWPLHHHNRCLIPSSSSTST